MKNEIAFLKQLYNDGKLDQLDNHIGVIIDSKDTIRLESVLEVFKSKRNDKKFEHLLSDIERYLERRKN